MVGNAHIDPMWIWDWDEGMHEVLQTFRAAADRLDEDPELRFTASSASYYRWVLETSPALFARIRRHVDAGRWVVTGGQWVEPDCNLPAGESVCRQFLYGQRFLADHLGVTATVGYNIDSFGHSGTLPQLLAASGIGAYVFMRPGPAEKEIASPAFRWRGTDGTELPTYRIPDEYSTEGAEEELIRGRADGLLALSSALGIPLMAFFGVGDHGGGPTRLAMRTVHALSAERGGTVAFGDPATYFEALGDEARRGLPVVEGELQWHAVGCYSARADLKQANGKAEDALVAAEALNEMCRLLTGDAPDVRRELADAWEGVLFAQFHDALGGTCTDRATAAVHALLVSGASRAERVAVRALHRVAEHVDTWAEGAETAEGLEASAVGGLPVPLLAFNPHSWPVTGPVSIPHPIAVATDAQGRRVPVQQIPSGEVTYSPTRSLLQVTVPSLGYRRYWLHATDPDAGTPQAGVEPARAGEDGVLRNGLLELRVDTTTGALADAVATGSALPAGTHLLAGGVRPIVVGDESDTWSHGVARYGGDEDSGRLLSVGVVESGPVRATVRSVWSFGERGTTVTQDVSVYEGRCLVEVELDVEWHEASRVLKLVVPVALDAPESTAGAAYGSAARPCSGHEEPMVHWVDLSDPGAGWGLACTSEGAGGYDALGVHAPPHRPAQSPGGRPRVGLGHRRSRRLPGDRPGASPDALLARPPRRHGPGGPAAPGGRRAAARAPGGAGHLAPRGPRSRGVGGGGRGGRGDHARPQTGRGRGRHGGPPVGGRRPGRARPPDPRSRPGARRGGLGRRAQAP